MERVEPARFKKGTKTLYPRRLIASTSNSHWQCHHWSCPCSTNDADNASYKSTLREVLTSRILLPGSKSWHLVERNLSVQMRSRKYPAYHSSQKRLLTFFVKLPTLLKEGVRPGSISTQCTGSLNKVQEAAPIISRHIPIN